ncbi:MAG: fasciclin domain-containing protein [Xenococcaceae cyanobacterium]
MKSKNSWQKFVAVLSLTGGTLLVGMPALAQFFYPSSSFFQPAAFYLQQEEIPTLEEFLDQNQAKVFVSKLNEVNLINSLEKERPLTVFAPTDAAFAALPPTIQKKLSDPKNLQKVLKYHLVSGEITDKDIKNRQVATKLEGASVQIAGVPQGNKIGVKINDAMASEPRADFKLQVIPIDKVLLPPGF